MTVAWKIVWRNGIAPLLTTMGLIALKKALEEDDPKLIQRATTSPIPLTAVRDWPCEAADAIGYAFAFDMRNGGMVPSTRIHDSVEYDNKKPLHEYITVGEVEEFSAHICFECDKRLGEEARCRQFLNWYDNTSREEMRKELGEEVERELAGRVGCHFWDDDNAPIEAVRDWVMEQSN